MYSRNNLQYISRNYNNNADGSYKTQQGSFRPFTMQSALYFSERLLSNLVFTNLWEAWAEVIPQ